MANSTSRSKKIQLNLTPTLIIMEGSTAGKIGYRIKQQILQHYGEVPVIRFLWVDTDVNIPEGAENWFTKEERAELVGYNPNVVLKNLENFPTIKNWWPENARTSAGMITRGAAHQMRLIGRLSLFRMFNEATNGPSFYSKLEQATKSIHEIENIEATRKKSSEAIHYEVLDDSIRVIFIFSTCGGTGSSLSFDLAYLCRHLLRNVNPQLMAFSILPPVIDLEIRDESVLQRQKIRANTYAWFKEDQYLMENPHWYVEYPGIAEVDIASVPFDLHFLIDMVNENNNRLNSAEDIYKMIAQAIFLDTGTTIAGENSSFVTNVGILDQDVSGRRQAYSSISSASVVYPSERLRSFCGNAFAGEMLTRGLIGDADSEVFHTAIANILSEINLRDDALIRTLREERGVQLLKKPAIIKSEKVKKAKTLLISQMQEANQALNNEIAIIEREGKSTQASMEKALKSRITQMAIREGLTNAKGMVAALQSPETPNPEGQITSIRTLQSRILKFGLSEADVMEKRALFEQAIQKLAEMDGNLLRNAQQAVLHRQWTQVFNDRKLDCLTSLEQFIEAQLTFAAQQAALDIYNQLLTLLQNFANQLEGVHQAIRRVQANVKDAAQEALEPQAPAEGTFELNQEVLGDPAYFRAFYREKSAALHPKTVYQDYAGELAYRDLSSLQDWAENLLDAEIVQHAENQFSEAIDQTSLLDAARDYFGESAKEKIGEMMDKLLTYCSPFWQYERDWGRNVQEGKSIIGVEDKNNLLIPDRFRQNQQYNMVSTGFKHRIDVVRVKHGLPAFLLKDMNEYKVMYEAVRKRTHDPLQILPNNGEFEDIFPDTHKQSRQLFALGLVFDLIVQIGSFYYVDIHREYSGPHQIKPTSEYRLAQGRTNAEEALIHKPNYIKALAEELEKIVQRIGNEAAIKIINAAIVDLKKHIGSLPTKNEDMRPQLRREVTYLQDYIRTLGGIVETL